MAARRTPDETLPVGELGAEEFYDDDDLEELDETDSSVTAADLMAFDAEAMGEDEEAEALGTRVRAARGGADDPYVAGGERLQKVLAHAGVDGVVVTEVGVRVDPVAQEIRVDGSRILTDPDVLTVVLNKPAGVVTTMEDPDGRPTVAEYAQRYLAERGAAGEPASGTVRLVHVGRLDTETEGLLLLSNDGELSHRLMHPSYEIAKTYVAIVEGEVERWVPRKLRRGIELDDGPVAADRVTLKEAGPGGSIVEITLHSGRNRIVRRMLAAVGHPVRRLTRTRLGPLTTGSLRPGEVRALTGAEVRALQEVVGL